MTIRTLRQYLRIALCGVCATTLLSLATACGRPLPPTIVTEITDAAPDTPTVFLPDLLITSIDTILTNLTVPWGLAHSTQAGLYIAERGGRILHLPPDSTVPKTWATLDVYAIEEGVGPESGLMGIAIQPGTEANPVLYALATTWRSNGDRNRSVLTRLWRRIYSRISATGVLRYKNQVLRLTQISPDSVNIEVIVDNLYTNFYHAGGGIGFGPDSMLYVSVGDAILPPLAAFPDYLIGKILRYTPDGKIPSGNPFHGSPVWAYGLRNSQSFLWLPSGNMLATDHGPSGMDQEDGRTGMDELNHIRPGLNYGWPSLTGWQTATSYQAPIWVWRDPIAPGGLTMLHDEDGNWNGYLAIAGLRGNLEIVRAGAPENGGIFGWGSVASWTDFGRLRSVLSMHDGSILLTTSNRDARGQPRPGDDLLLRVWFNATNQWTEQ